MTAEAAVLHFDFSRGLKLLWYFGLKKDQPSHLSGRTLPLPIDYGKKAPEKCADAFASSISVAFPCSQPSPIYFFFGPDQNPGTGPIPPLVQNDCHGKFFKFLKRECNTPMGVGPAQKFIREKIFLGMSARPQPFPRPPILE